MSSPTNHDHRHASISSSFLVAKQSQSSLNNETLAPIFQVSGRRRSGDLSGYPSPSTCSSQAPLSFHRFDSVQRVPEIPKSGLGYRDSKGPIRRRPPSDRLGSGVCHSPSTDLTRDRWDSTFVSPIASEGGCRNVFAWGMSLIECWSFVGRSVEDLGDGGLCRWVAGSLHWGNEGLRWGQLDGARFSEDSVGDESKVVAMSCKFDEGGDNHELR
ncbi:hypothetical protein GQ457_15G020920 [Hibiscus cannabinus]